MRLDQNPAPRSIASSIRHLRELVSSTSAVRLAQGITELPAGERTMLSLIYFERLSATDISKCLNIDKEQIARLLDSAVESIRKSVAVEVPRLPTVPNGVEQFGRVSAFA